LRDNTSGNRYYLRKENWEQSRSVGHFFHPSAGTGYRWHGRL